MAKNTEMRVWYFHKSYLVYFGNETSLEVAISLQIFNDNLAHRKRYILHENILFEGFWFLQNCSKSKI